MIYSSLQTQPRKLISISLICLLLVVNTLGVWYSEQCPLYQNLQNLLLIKNIIRTRRDAQGIRVICLKTDP